MISLERLKRRGVYYEVREMLNTPEKVRELRERLEEKTKEKDYQYGIDY